MLKSEGAYQNVLKSLPSLFSVSKRTFSLGDHNPSCFSHWWLLRCLLAQDHLLIPYSEKPHHNVTPSLYSKSQQKQLKAWTQMLPKLGQQCGFNPRTVTYYLPPQQATLTGKTWYNPLLNDSSGTPTLWVSGIPGELGVSPSPSHDRGQAQVFSAGGCRTHWTPRARIQQSRPRQT